MKACRLAHLVTVLLSILFLILATVHGDGDPHPSGSCKNGKCIIAANQTLPYRNLSVNPCDNFYAHVCSGQKDYPFYDILVKIEGEILELFNNLTSNDMEALQKSKKFHDACTDRETRIRQGLSPIKNILSSHEGWPVNVPSYKWNNQNLSWREIHENFANSTGISALFDVIVQIHHNSGAHILSLGVPTVPSERAHFISRRKRETRSEDYRKYVMDVLRYFRNSSAFDIRADDLLADFQGIIALEDELDEIAILDDDETNIVDDLQITTIQELQNNWNDAVLGNSNYSINWLKTISDRLEGTGIVINASENITLKPGAFVANFARVLLNTPPRTIVNYIYWKIVDNLLPYVRSDFYNPHARERADAASFEGLCINNNKLFHAVAYMWVNRHLAVEVKKAALEIVKSIEKEMGQEISDSSWLDDETKSVNLEKINAMRNVIGYPDWYDEPGKIDEYYRELKVGPNHFENVLAYNRFEVKKKLSKLRSPVDDSEIEWSTYPYNFGADYLQRLNFLNFPAAILQPPFFEYERPTVSNYALFGAVVGHEIAHGFDSKGQFFDGAGRKGKWWSQSMIDAYKIKAQCFVKQYDNYTGFDWERNVVYLNGTITQVENIADSIGFRAALRAYKRLKNDEKTNNVKLPQLSDLSDEQLYFYGLAYMMCSPEGAASAPGDMNSYSPNRVRIIGSLSNMQEFADAFHCPPGSPMNPSEKCLIWD